MHQSCTWPTSSIFPRMLGHYIATDAQPCHVALSVWLQPFHATTPATSPTSHHHHAIAFAAAPTGAMTIALPVAMSPITKACARVVLASHSCIWPLHKAFFTRQTTLDQTHRAIPQSFLQQTDNTGSDTRDQQSLKACQNILCSTGHITNT